MIYRYVFSEWRSIRPVDINQYDITMATHYDITMGNDIARDSHCEITMGNDAASDIHCDVTMGNDIARDVYFEITMSNDVARDIHYDVTMSNGIAMCTYHSVTMHTDVAMNLFCYVFSALCLSMILICGVWNKNKNMFMFDHSGLFLCRAISLRTFRLMTYLVQGSHFYCDTKFHVFSRLFPSKNNEIQGQFGMESVFVLIM